MVQAGPLLAVAAVAVVVVVAGPVVVAVAAVPVAVLVEDSIGSGPAALMFLWKSLPAQTKSTNV